MGLYPRPTTYSWRWQFAGAGWISRPSFGVSRVTTPVVVTENLCKQYCSWSVIIDAIANVSLTMRQGEFVAICGRSGSGKSTLMNLLGLLERPNSGHYLLNGTEIAGLRERRRAAIRNREIGFVFQLPTLLPRSTALENVELPLVYSGVRGTERHRRATEALDRVGLASSQRPLAKPTFGRRAAARRNRSGARE